MTCDLREVYDPVAAVAVGDGETHCSKVRSDEVRTDQVAEPSRTGSCGSPLAEQGRPSAFDLPFWCAFGEQGRSTALTLSYSFLETHEAPRRNQILPGYELFFTEEMLQRCHTGRDFRQHEIDLLGQIVQLPTQIGSVIAHLDAAAGFFVTRLREASFFMTPPQQQRWYFQRCQRLFCRRWSAQ